MEGSSNHAKGEGQISSLILSVLPSSSLRDIISLVFIFLFLPQSVSLVLLVGHIFTKSDIFNNNFISGALMQDRSMKFFDLKSLLIKTANIFTINSLVYYFLKQYVFKKRNFLFNYLVILSKCIISCDLVGTGSVNTFVSNRKYSSKIQYENRIINNKLINLLICFLFVNYINYIIDWMKLKVYHHNFHYTYNNKYYIILSLYVINSMIMEKLTNHENSIEEIHHFIDEDKGSISEIKLDSRVRNSSPSRSAKSSMAVRNFENFIANPFINSKSLILRTRENLTVNFTFQPFWSILAGLKTIIKNPASFSGKYTECKNNGGKFIKSPISLVEVSILLIDDSKIILKFLDNIPLTEEGFEVKINDVKWNYFKLLDMNNENFIVIYGLSSLFQYEVDLIHEKKNLNHFIINTVNNKTVLNESLKENSSLLTLQTSLISTIQNLNSLKVKFRKFKKDEHKKVIEVRNNMSSIKNKISKYTDKPVNNDNRTFGKLKGLKHSIIQLEQEIKNLEDQLAQLIETENEAKTNFSKNESAVLETINQLKVEFKDYEERINHEKEKVKHINSEIQTLHARNNKLLNKIQNKRDEITKLHNDLKNYKKVDILMKYQKKVKKVEERFEIILPKVMDATSDLQIELEECLNN